MIDDYAWRGGREAMLRFGPTGAPVVIAAGALFEEANRTRALLAAVLRGLAGRGVASVLPDLPGSGDSLVATEAARLADWREAYAAAAAAAGAGFSVALRGGALVDGAVGRRWRLAPVDGAALVRDMTRARIAAAKESGGRFDPATLAPPGPAVELAGNRVARALIAELAQAVPTGAARVVRLAGDAAPADRRVDGAALWRRAEPGMDAALAAALADDIANWVHACAA